MNDAAAAEFESLASVIVSRFFRQNAKPLPSVAEIRVFAARLRTLVAERGLPRPRPPNEVGAPGDLPDAECSSLVHRVVEPASDPLLGEAARQLVKACFYPEFRNCRDSFRAVSPDGVCRRQQLTRARLRVSGSHCVDCPHWVGLPPTQHRAYLAQEWRGDAAEFTANHGVFLPEDFRALRQWLHRQARQPEETAGKQ